MNKLKKTILVTYQQLQYWETNAYIASQNLKYERRVIQEEIEKFITLAQGNGKLDP